jgi:serine/threonine-protein kinase
MAPEQVRHGKVDRQTDVYSAAVVLWQLLAGRRLFKARNDGELIYQLLEAPIRAPSLFNPKVSPELDAVVLRGLSRDRGARYKTAKEMLLDLESKGSMVTQRVVADWAVTASEEELSARTKLVSRISRTSFPDDLIEAAVTLSDASVKLYTEGDDPETSAVVEKPSAAAMEEAEFSAPLRMWSKRTALVGAAAAAVVLLLLLGGLAFRSAPQPPLESVTNVLPGVARDAKRRAAAAMEKDLATPDVPVEALPPAEPSKPPPPRVIIVPRSSKPAPASLGNSHLYKRE